MTEDTDNEQEDKSEDMGCLPLLIVSSIIGAIIASVEWGVIVLWPSFGITTGWVLSGVLFLLLILFLWGAFSENEDPPKNFWIFILIIFLSVLVPLGNTYEDAESGNSKSSTGTVSTQDKQLSIARQNAVELANDIENENWGAVWERMTLSERSVSKSEFIVNNQGLYINSAEVEDVWWKSSDVATAEIEMKTIEKTATLKVDLEESPLPTDHNYWEIVGGSSSF